MTETSIQQLNDEFARPGRVTFVAGPGGLPVAELRSTHGAGAVALHGGQALAFQPRGQAPVLWTSREAIYAPGKAIRGGIPVCWPWFGPHPDDPTKPAHGFVRTRRWRVLETAGSPGGAAAIRLGISDDDATRALWPHAFELQLAVVVGVQLRVELAVRNTGDEPFTYSGALHSYFAIGDIAAVTIHGLESCEYIDKADDGLRKTQAGPVTITSETDRVYLDTDATCAIEDAAQGRRVEVAKSGSRTTVVWNPWEEKARRLPDFGDDEYHSMVCVETANADGDQVTVPPGGAHQLALIVGVR